MKFRERLKKLWRGKWAFGSVIVFFSLVFGLVLGIAYEELEWKSYDLRFRIRGPQSTKQDDIVIVDIDEQTFASLPAWPFPRSFFARVIRNLWAADAKLIVVDVMFTGPAAGDRREDLALAGAIKRAGNVILAGGIVTEVRRGREGANSYVEAPYRFFLDATGAKWGIINTDEDTDGYLRRYLLFQTHNRKGYLPLSLQAYLQLQRGADGAAEKIRFDVDGDFWVGNKRIPKRDFNSTLINYRGPARTFETYSFSEVIDDSTFNLQDFNREGVDDDVDRFTFLKENGVFKDKVVFVGASAKVLQDNKLTPFFGFRGRKRPLPGVEVHANALSTLLRGDFITRQGFLSSFSAVIFLTILTMVITKLLKPFKGLFAVAGLVLFYLVVTLYFFINHRLWMDIVTPMFSVIFCYVGNVIHQTLTEQRERVRIKKSWQQYMPKDVIEHMLESGDLPKFGGERREVTILFSDIRGFTTFTERHTSHAVVKKLSEYLTEMVDVIFQNAGTLDKFVGDEIMAVYGAPYYYKEHAKKACLTAIEMVDRLRVLQRTWASKKEDWFQIGIGINSGKVILGNLGSAQHFDYTAIGDDVNLGARLEGANKQYGTTIIISEFTYSMVKNEAKVRELDLVRVKGKKKPVRIFELRGMEDLTSIEQELVIDVYSEGLEYYKNLNWYQALQAFNRVLNYFPTDGPSRVYVKRCMDFIENPPPVNWDGVYEFTTK